jgi:hypothetical protein
MGKISDQEYEARQLTNRCLHCGEYLGMEMNRVEVRMTQLKNQISMLQMSLKDLENFWKHLEEGFCDSHHHYLWDQRESSSNV